MAEASLAARLLRETTAGGYGRARQLRHDRIRGFPVTGVTQEADVTGRIEHEEVFQGVTRLLATIILCLIRGLFGALDGSFGPILHTRGGDEGSSDWCGVSLVAKSSAVRAGSSPWSARA